MNRRQFLGSSLAALAIPASGVYARYGSSKPKRAALIGCGWYGKIVLFRLLQVAPVEVVGLADVDRKVLEEAGDLVAQRQKSGKKPALYKDFRQLLEEQQPEIAIVSTPDHWHALAMIEAARAGTDVYVEKPISRDVLEGRAMVAAARKYGRVVQVNTQRRSTPHLIEARDRIIREGKLGRIGHVEVCCYYHMRLRGSPPDSNPPEYLDWDLWTGPAPLRPYNPAIHPRRWRSFMEYGNGIVGDMCIHMLDTVRWMLDLGWPKRISSSGGIYVEKGGIANITDTQTAIFEYDDLTVVWQHRTYGNPPDPDYPWAAIFYGDKGTLKASVHSYDFIPFGKGERVHQKVTYELEQYPEDKTERDIELHVAPAVRRHLKNFLECIETRQRPVADIEEGHISSACCILANVAQQRGITLELDPKTGEVKGEKEDPTLLQRPYRKPWVHPTPESV
jgi:predicted dehydrogenase